MQFTANLSLEKKRKEQFCHQHEIQPYNSAILYNNILLCNKIQ